MSMSITTASDAFISLLLPGLLLSPIMNKRRSSLRACFEANMLARTYHSQIGNGMENVLWYMNYTSFTS